MANKAYLEYITDWLSPLGVITSRAMMGGHILYCDGIVFALIADTLFLKADDTTRPNFQALGLLPFQPFPDKPGTMQYYPPPAEFFEDPDIMFDWARSAVEAGKRAAAKRKPKTRSTRKAKPRR